MRRFPEPWTIHSSESAFWVEDADGKRFAYCYYKNTEWGSTSQDKALTKEEAHRIARNIAKLAER